LEKRLASVSRFFVLVQKMENRAVRGKKRVALGPGEEAGGAFWVPHRGPWMR
jgi:hypothetical protein